MPRVIVTPAAVLGLNRCRRFLHTADQDASERASKVITQHFLLLERKPETGRIFPLNHALRELIIPFGKTGYTALYRYEAIEDVVYVLAFRHQREAGY